MAKSLMELYGGGMVYPPRNYQLGGLIASSRRGREYQGEMRKLKEQQEKIAKEQQRSGMWGSILGTVGSIAGSVLGPGGTALGAGIGGGLGRYLGEKQYKTTKIGEGKYAKEKRGDLREAQDDYKAGMGERALVSGLQSALMGEAYGKIGKGIDKGFGKVEQAFREGQTTGELFGFGEGVKDFGQELGVQFFDKAPGAGAGAGAGAGGAPPGAGKESFFGKLFGSLKEPSPYMKQYNAAAQERAEGFKNLFKPSPYMQQYNKAMQARGQNLKDWWGSRPTPDEYLQGQMGRANRLKGGGLINYMMPRRMQAGGYATATDPLVALEQMGFEGIADDPQLKEYMEDLPQFQHGYAQQIGDITTAGQQQMGQLGAQMRQQRAQAGFAGGGVGAFGAQQARTGVGQETQRGRRGVVEGYQANLLGAIRDIESKGEFEFGSGARDVGSQSTILTQEQRNAGTTCASLGLIECSNGECVSNIMDCEGG